VSTGGWHSRWDQSHHGWLIDLPSHWYWRLICESPRNPCFPFQIRSRWSSRGGQDRYQVDRIRSRGVEAIQIRSQREKKGAASLAQGRRLSAPRRERSIEGVVPRPLPFPSVAWCQARYRLGRPICRVSPRGEDALPIGDRGIAQARASAAWCSPSDLVEIVLASPASLSLASHLPGRGPAHRSRRSIDRLALAVIPRSRHRSTLRIATPRARDRRSRARLALTPAQPDSS
jgi:hypothetical protein